MWNDSTRQNDPNLSAQAQSCAYIPEMVSNIYLHTICSKKQRNKSCSISISIRKKSQIHT